jgi:hypothetical protein
MTIRAFARRYLAALIALLTAAGAPMPPYE